MKINDIMKQVPAWAELPKAKRDTAIEKAAGSYVWEVFCIAPDMRPSVLWHDIDILLSARSEYLDTAEELEHSSSPEEDFGEVFEEGVSPIILSTPEREKAFREEMSRRISEAKSCAAVLSQAIRLLTWNLAEYGYKFCQPKEVQERKEAFHVSLSCLDPCTFTQSEDTSAPELPCHLSEKETANLWEALSQGGFIVNCPKDAFLFYFAKIGEIHTEPVQWYNARGALTSFALFCLLMTQRLNPEIDFLLEAKRIPWKAFGRIFGEKFVEDHIATLRPCATNLLQGLEGGPKAKQLRDIFKNIFGNN